MNDKRVNINSNQDKILMPVFWQAVKFVIVGFLNTAIDFGALNVLMFITGIASGGAFALFKGVSFLTAVVNSYFLNKFWTFRSIGSVNLKESGKFFLVSMVGLLINVGIASVVVNLISNPFPLYINKILWANFGALAATAASMVWNFIGYKFLVFKG